MIGAAFGPSLFLYGRKTGHCYLLADMIYLENITARQQVRIPWNGLAERDGGPAVLTVWSATDARKAYDAEWQESDGQDAYYAVGEVKLPRGLVPGEYEYRLAQGAQVLSRGVLQIGHYGDVPVQKGETTITFKQYDGKR